MGLKIAQHHIDTVRLVGDRGGLSVWIGGALLHTGGVGSPTHWWPPYPPSLLSVNDPRITADLLTTLPTRFTLLPRTLMKYRPKNIKAVVNLAKASQGIMLSQL